MKIRVVGQLWYHETCRDGSSVPLYKQPDSDFWKENNFITIRNSFQPDDKCAVPIDGDHILKLCFDDATSDPDGTLILFNESMARKIADFLKHIDTTRTLFINCAAGISRSGAVGEVLNDYFNRYLEINELDNLYFRTYSRQVCGNPLAVKAFATVKDNADSGQFIAIQKAAIAALDDQAAITPAISAKYERRLRSMVETLRKLGFNAKVPAGSFYLYVKAPKAASDGTVFTSGEDFSQWLIKTKLISSVPWDDAGNYVRFSATFVARGGQEEEKAVLDEFARRLSDAKFTF